MITVRALDPSCARASVSVSVEIAVQRAISAFVASGITPMGQTVTLNGGVGNFAPSPAATTSDVPLAAGDGAVATVEYAKFLCASGTRPFRSWLLGLLLRCHTAHRWGLRHSNHQAE